jgi:hypothetical protein
MSSKATFDSSFEAFREQGRSKRGLRLTERLCDVSHFLLRMRVQFRYGTLSRAPLKLLCLQVTPDAVECDYLARAADQWDADLAENVSRRHLCLQTLRDAMDLRELLFRTVPDCGAARLRVYRRAQEGTHELIMLGYVHRNDHSARGVHSLSMRAKVLGFHFHLENDRFHEIPNDTCPIGPDQELED